MCKLCILVIFKLILYKSYWSNHGLICWGNSLVKSWSYPGSYSLRSFIGLDISLAVCGQLFMRPRSDSHVRFIWSCHCCVYMLINKGTKQPLSEMRRTICEIRRGRGTNRVSKEEMYLNVVWQGGMVYQTIINGILISRSIIPSI